MPRASPSSGNYSINSHQQLQKYSVSILRSGTIITKMLPEFVNKDPYQIQKVHVSTPDVFPTAKEKAKTSAKPGKKNVTAKIIHAHKQTINISYLSTCCHTSQTAHESTDKHQQTLRFESSIKHVQQNNASQHQKCRARFQKHIYNMVFSCLQQPGNCPLPSS